MVHKVWTKISNLKLEQIGFIIGFLGFMSFMSLNSKSRREQQGLLEWQFAFNPPQLHYQLWHFMKVLNFLGEFHSKKRLRF